MTLFALPAMKRFSTLALMAALTLGAATLLTTNSADAQAVRRRPLPVRPQPGRPVVGVPELDPSAAGAALALLLGGAVVITARRREA